MHDTRGNYTVKSGHHRAMDLWRKEQGLTVAISRDQWRYVWTASVPDKVKIWHWRAFQDVVPFLSRLVTKGVDCSVVCPMCEEANETLGHFVKGCPLLQSVVTISSIRDKFQQINIDSYGEFFAYIEKHWSKYERDLWMTILWMAWDARNR